MADSEGRRNIVYALCHEVGNLVGAIRLNAHLIDEDSPAIELATASVEIDDSSARIRSLLALVRPLLTGAAEPASGVDAETLVRGVADALDEYGGHGVALRVEAPDGLPRVPGRPEALHHLLATLGYYAVEEARPRGRVGIGAGRVGGNVVFRVEDDGREDKQLGSVRAGVATGRALACEVAKILVADFGGAVDARRVGDVTRIELTLPALE